MLVAIVILLLWIAISGLIHIIIRNKSIRLSFGQIIVFFGCKIAVGELYGYIFRRFYNGDDTWGLHHDGLIQYKRLMQSPRLFFSDIFSLHPYPAYDTFYFKRAAYLENLEYSIFTKTIALSDVISHCNYYINVVFFNFLGFWGLYFLYKLIAEHVPANNRSLAAAVLFLFPPALFWLSGIRAEGLLIFFTGILLYQFNQWLKHKKIITGLTCIICFGMDFIFRDGFAMLLVPALAAWAFTRYFKMDAKKIFSLVYAVIIAAVIGSSYILPPPYSALTVIAARQHDFFSLKGNTRFNLTALDNGLLSFIKVLPESLLNTFIRPFPWEAKGLFQWFSFFENITILALIGLSIFVSGGSRQRLTKPLILVFVLAGLFNYILIGYIVPFPGAIIRYKVIPELFLISACLLWLPAGWRKAHRTTASTHI